MKKARPIEQRFSEKFTPEPNSGCWIWTDGLNAAGYGKFQVGQFRGVLAHRQSYELYKGKIPDGLCLDHLCRVRCCVNPDHLEPVTLEENIRRGNIFRGKQRCHCRRGHPYSGDNLWISKDGFRHCRTCVNAARRRRRKALKR